MSLKHFEHLANLERNIIKQQFVKAAKAPVTMSYGAKKLKGSALHASSARNVPQVAKITAVTGDVKIKNPYTAGRTRQYPNPTEKQIREQKGKTAALVANDGLTPAQGGALGLMNEQGAMLGTSGKPLYRPRLKTKTQVM